MLTPSCAWPPAVSGTDAQSPVRHRPTSLPLVSHGFRVTAMATVDAGPSRLEPASSLSR